MMHIDIAAVEILSTPDEKYFEEQVTWKKEIGSYMQNIREDAQYGLLAETDLIKKRHEELQHAQDVRIHYEKKLESANNLYMELMACLQHFEKNKSEINRKGICAQQGSVAAKVAKKKCRRFVRNDKLNRSRTSIESEMATKNSGMRYSDYHSPSAGRIRRTKYYATYPKKAPKNSSTFRRTKSLNLKLQHSVVDCETQTEDICPKEHELPSSTFQQSKNGPNHHSQELLTSKLSSLNLHSEHCESKNNIPFHLRINQTRQDCMVCYMFSQHLHNTHYDKQTDRPNRLYKKHQTMSKIRSFLKTNLRRYNSTQDIVKDSSDNCHKKTFKWSFFGSDKANKVLNGKSAVQKLVSSLSFPNIPLSVNSEA